ncbi:TATA-binding related factor [Hesseltinella vesiculosa]|uniref:Mediator of RNA polymerase II transcription subunit 20 n=1 Tax=Hesseltinella vesiculosa TaxID=101127 RepID=A0A1X2GNR4_9FUNG|nr:TATA-binding related factor [Hesseltinella vesiculosa]
MGVTCIVRWKNATGMRDFTYIADYVTKTLHGKNTGPWSLTVKMYRDANAMQRQGNDSKAMHQVALGQRPGQLYCMVDGGVVVEAEKEMESIFTRLKNIWQLRQSITIEGTSYDIDDFTLRVANILVGSTYKGLLLEIDYHPCTIPRNADDLFREFIASILPPTAQLSCEFDYAYEQVGLSQHDFSFAHTGYQYMILFRNDGLL